jgi:A/G-specific adenine glycosylase
MLPYFERFMTAFPSIQILAAASMEDVLKVWEGLGYYARARNLHAAAQVVTSTYGGRLPATFESLVALPGIGRYIGGALASMAFGENVAAVDGNARRVLSRFFHVEKDVTNSSVQKGLEDLARQLLPSGRAGVFNEALMELGALICTPRLPQCELCPLRTECRSRAIGDATALPIRSARKSIPHYDVAAAVTIGSAGLVLVTQRNAGDMLGGLWEFPGGKRERGESLSACLVREMQEELDVHVDVGAPVIVVKHAYTHFRITLHAFLCTILVGQLRCLDCAAFRWVEAGDLDELPMSVADRKIARAVQNLKVDLSTV